MAEKILSSRILLRHDSAANLASTNPVLLAGEVCFELANIPTLEDGSYDLAKLSGHKFKIGDGVHTYNELPYTFDPEKLEIEIPEAQVFQGQITGEQTADEAITASIPEGSTARVGDFAIIKKLIAGTDKYEYTAYIYNGTAWAALDGNYSAKNVLLNGKVTLSGSYTAIGNITKSSTSATKEYDWDGMTVQGFLEDLLSKVLYPTKPTPSVSMSLTGTGYKEIGTTVTPSFTVTYDPKTYAYGSKSSSTFGSYTYAAPSDVTVTVTGGTNASLTGTMTGTGNNKHTLTLKDDSFVVDTNTSYYGTAVSCAYGDGAIPLDNAGKEYADAKVTAGTASSTTDTGKITGYREGCFFGTVSTAGFTAASVNSAIIRGLSGKTGKNYAAGTYTFTIPVGATAVLVACPKGKTGATEVLNTTVNAKYTTLVGADQIANTVQVGGADATLESIGSFGTDYNVWAFIPTEAFGASADVKITLGA